MVTHAEWMETWGLGPEAKAPPLLWALTLCSLTPFSCHTPLEATRGSQE